MTGRAPHSGQAEWADVRELAVAIAEDRLRRGVLSGREIRDALDEAYEQGRQSVGLGDFLPDPCGDEYSNYPWYIAEQYGDYVSCTRRRGHDGLHEHEDSGMRWSTR